MLNSMKAIIYVFIIKRGGQGFKENLREYYQVNIGTHIEKLWFFEKHAFGFLILYSHNASQHLSVGA